ncbi:MAG: dihydrodipicolinate synthase family protein [Candidatus Promineifilaceae bacterium]
MRSLDEIRAGIRGPVFPMVVPFTEDEDVDHAALESYVDYLITGGAPVLLLTVGTSRFNLLTRKEMLAVNETVIKAASGRAITIAAGPGPSSGSTRENITFAKAAEKAGADAILVLYPERWYGDKPVAKFFTDVADNIDIGLMIHAVPMRDGFGGVKALKYLDADLIAKFVNHPNIVGVKEENGDRAMFEDILNRYNDGLPIIGAGGAMRRFINDSKLGSYTFLVGIGSFKPALAVEFFQAVMAGNEARAAQIAELYEDPYFDFAVKLGWHRALKETLHQLNIMPPYERSPFNRISETERSQLREVLVQCGWL